MAFGPQHQVSRLWQPESAKSSTRNPLGHQQSSCSTVSLSYRPIQLRQGENAWWGSSRWALVLPTNTVKIRGGRSIFPHHSQPHVLPSHTVKTRRGWSTLHHGEVYLSTSHISEPLFPGGTSVLRIHTIQTPPNLPHSHTAPWSPLRGQNRDIQKRTWSMNYAWLL